MSGRRMKNGSGDSATVMFRTDDPGLDRVNIASAPERLRPLQKRLAGCTVVADTAGVNYQNFVRNIKGVAPLSVKGRKLLLVRTRSTIFLLSNEPHESLYENPALMSLNLRRQCSLQTENGKGLYLIEIDSRTAAVITGLADKSGKEGKADRLKPGEGTAVDLDAFRSKLASSKAATLDVAAFAQSVKFVAVFQDGDDRSYYFLIAGQEDENPYRLYVDEPVHSEGAVYLDHGKERCILMAER